MTDPKPGELAYRALRREARTTRRTRALCAGRGVLARLSRSPLRDQFVLKGGVLLAAFGNRRPTKDVDLAALAVSNDVDSILEMMRDILTTETLVDDGLKIDGKSLCAQVIRDEDEYSGVRVSAKATLNGYAGIGQTRWAAWRRRTNDQLLPEQFDEVVRVVITFGAPVLEQTTSGHSWDPEAGKWERRDA